MVWWPASQWWISWWHWIDDDGGDERKTTTMMMMMMMMLTPPWLSIDWWPALTLDWTSTSQPHTTYPKWAPWRWWWWWWWWLWWRWSTWQQLWLINNILESYHCDGDNSTQRIISFITSSAVFLIRRPDDQCHLLHRWIFLTLYLFLFIFSWPKRPYVKCHLLQWWKSRLKTLLIILISNC